MLDHYVWIGGKIINTMLDLEPSSSKKELAKAISARGFMFSVGNIYSKRHTDSNKQSLVMSYRDGLWYPELDYIRENIKVRATGQTIAEMERADPVSTDAAQRKAIADAKAAELKARSMQRAEDLELDRLIDKHGAEQRHIEALLILQNNLHAGFNNALSSLVASCGGDQSRLSEVRTVCRTVIEETYHNLFTAGGELEIK